MRGVLFLALLGSAACVSDEGAPVPTGEHYQYVVGQLHIPANNTQAREYALDLNGDKSVDNQLGMIFGTLQGQGFGVADTAVEALLRGNAILLADLQTEAFDATEASALQTFIGANPVPSACTDPTMITTCGRHLATRSHYDIEPGTESLLGVGPFSDGRLLAPVTRLSITLGIDPAAPLRVDLRAAKVRVTNASADGADAIIAGGITQDDLDDVVIPEVARNLARIVDTDCDPAMQPAPCGCPDGSRGKLLQKYFDPDNNCTVSLQEVRTNSLVQALFSTDVKLDGRELLSFGIGARLVPASF